MPVSEAEWASITALIEKKVADKGESFTTGIVIKRDPDRRVIWTRDFGDEPIPVVAFNNSVRTFDTTLSGIAVRNLQANAIVPEIGNTVLIARELGTRRLPRCLGVIDGAGIVPSESGLAEVPPAGLQGLADIELAYAENVANALVTATTAAGAQQVLLFPSISLDGNTWIQIDIAARAAVSDWPCRCGLRDNGTDIFGGAAAGSVMVSYGGIYPAFYSRSKKFKPASGTHIYDWRSFRDSAGTSTFYSSSDWPIHGRIVRVA